MRIIILISLILFTGMTCPRKGKLSLAEIFTDNMVLQRDQPLKVWGWSLPFEKVSIAMGDQEYSSASNVNGKWIVEIPPQKTGGPLDLKVKSSSDEILLQNILIGDVWLCSGQSNMEWPVLYSANPEKEIENARDSLIRHYKIPRSWSKTPEEQLDSSHWEVNHPDNTGEFTAVGYYFARHLRKTQNIPIGLINSSWGGSRLEPWMSAEAMQSFVDGDINDLLDQKEREQVEAKKKIEELLPPPPTADELENAKIPGQVSDAWLEINLPSLWEYQGFPGMDGVAYLRKEFILSPDEASEEVVLQLGMIDDSDWTYVNGELVGSMEGQWNVLREYKVNPEILRTGSNIILIRVEDTGGGGGLYGDSSELFIKTINGVKSLAGSWKFRVEDVKAEGFAANQIPVILYNKMIHPILDFPIKGVIWYQGESNASPEDAHAYRELFPALIQDWRKLWGIGDFPFLWVQLANFLEPDEQPSESGWAILRESQTKTLKLPNTAQAVSIDIGEAEDIHPKNKQDVGLRLALAARKLAYGEDLVYSGPVYKSDVIDDASITISFDHIGSGLVSKDKYGYVKGFAIAGQDKKFQWAKAKIEENTVRVWAPGLEEPMYVRYAWGINPDDANLYNREGLPACPFRTDE